MNQEESESSYLNETSSDVNVWTNMVANLGIPLSELDSVSNDKISDYVYNDGLNSARLWSGQNIATSIGTSVCDSYEEAPRRYELRTTGGEAVMLDLSLDFIVGMREYTVVGLKMSRRFPFMRVSRRLTTRLTLKNRDSNVVWDVDVDCKMRVLAKYLGLEYNSWSKMMMEESVKYGESQN